MAGHFRVVISPSPTLPSPIFLLKDESLILFQNWLDPSKEIKKQIRSEFWLVADVCVDGWAGPTSECAP